MEQTEIICNICYNKVAPSECAVFEDTLIDLLDVIFSENENHDVKKIRHPKICNICHEKIHELFNFKSKCVYIEDVLTPYINTADNELDLKEIGVKENLFAEMTIQDIDTVCRLCFLPVSSDKIDIKDIQKDDKLQSILENNLSELNLHVQTESFICDACLRCLQKYADLIEGCLSSKIKLKYNSSKLSKEVCSDDGNNKDMVIVTEEAVKKKLKVHCTKCSYVTTYNSQLRRHMLSHKTEQETVLFKCRQCPFQSKYDRSVRHHMNTVHVDNRVSCTHCDKQLKNKIGLKKHVLICHSDEQKMFYCDQCNYKTPYKNGLRDHILTHTDNCPMFSCDKCTYQTKFQNKLKRHFMLHDDKPPKYDCTVCDYKTNYKENLKKHMRKHNADSETFSCDQCSYKTKYKEYLKYHKVIHADPSKIKKYKCSICSYETIHRGNVLKQHMKSHKEVPTYVYECNKCKYETPYRSNFINHEKKFHMEPTFFHCNDCDFKTKYKISLAKHIQNHLKVN